MPILIPCCVDVPAGGALVRYGLTELLRGLGLQPDWVCQDDARLAVTVGDANGETGGRLAMTEAACQDLTTPRMPQETGWVEIEGERWPVPVGPPGPATRGDALASAAWWLAGLAEASVAERDEHGRVPFWATLQARFVDAPGGPFRPPVDALRRLLADTLRQRGVAVPGRTWGRAPWAVALSHDLDAVRTRRGRAALAELSRGEIAQAVTRGLGPDRRRDSLTDLRRMGERHGGRGTWFVKPGAWSPQDVPGGLDPGTVRHLREWRETGHEVGWHPGYGAHGHPARLAVEAERFEKAFSGAPRLARTHFLRWDDATPGHLAAHGVEIDSTLGWSAQPGFRRGTAHPFLLFDPAAGCASGVWEMPLAVMDTSLSTHLGLGPEAVGHAVRRVFHAARQSGGVAVVLWHNQLGADTAGWTARLDALDRELGQARADGAAVGPLAALLEAWHTDLST